MGDPARARTIAKYLDPVERADLSSGHEKAGTQHGHFALYSERGFLTITGTYKGTPVSIVAIGMGAPNMDFFVRECREIVEGATRVNYGQVSFSGAFWLA